MIEGLDTASTIFLYGFIIGAAITLLYVLFGDIAEGLSSGEIGFLNPTVILSFIAIFCGAGFIFEYTTELNTIIVSIISALISFALVSLIHMFILVPVSKAEQSTAYSLDELVGQLGKLTVPIPKDGLGQISIERNFGYYSHPAKSSDNQPIAVDSKVRIISVENGVFTVEEYHESSLTNS